MSRGREAAVEFDRVSSNAQEDGQSLGAQRRLGEEYARKYGLQVVRAWSEVESASKENDRKQFFAMVEFIKERDIKHVVFDKVDRAVRGFKSAVIIQDLMEQYGVKFHFTRENLVIDKDSPPSEKLRFYLGTILAKYYIDNLKVEIKKGLDARTDAGLWNYKAPIGYLNFRDPTSKTATVIPDPQLAPAIKEIFELYATGEYTYAELIPILNRVSEKQYDWKLLPPLISNPFYYGAICIKGKIVKKKGLHEPLVSKALWDACQRSKGIRAAKYAANDAKRSVSKPFMRLIKCGHCSHWFTGETVIKATGKAYVYYRCSNKACSHNKVRWPQNRLNDMLSEAFKPFAAFTPKAVDACIQTIADRVGDFHEYTKRNIDELIDRELVVKQRLLTAEEMLRQGRTTKARYEEEVQAANAELDKISIEIVAYRNTDRKTFDKSLCLIQLFTKVTDYNDVGADLLKKAQLAKMFLSNPVILNGTLQFEYVNPLDELLKIVGGQGWWAHLDLNQGPWSYEHPALTN